MTNKTPESPTSRLPRPRRREFPAPLTQPLTNTRELARTPVVSAPLPDPEPYYDEFDDFDGYEQDAAYLPRRHSFLTNPYVLAAVAVFGAIVMAIVVVAMAGGGGGGGGFPVAAATEQNPLTPKPSGIGVETIAAATVREGPNNGGELGTIPRGQKVTVTGRDADAKWFQIVFPQNSTLRGWLPATALKIADLNPQAIAIVTVTPRPQATQAPTQVVQQRPTVAATVEATATVATGPDLAVAIACTAGSPVQVIVKNAGAATVQQAATVSVLVGAQVKSTLQVQLNLEPGSSVTIPTDQVVSPPSTSVQVALAGTADIDPSDNSAQCTVGAATTPTVPVATAQSGTTPTATTQAATATPTTQVQVTPTLTATPIVQTVSP